MRPVALASLSDFFPPSAPITVWVAAGDADAVNSAYPAIDAALARHPGHRLLITVPSGDVAALRRRLPHETVAAQPGLLATGWWLRRLKPLLVIVIGADVTIPARSAPRLKVVRFDGDRDVSTEAILATLPTAVSLPMGGSDRLAETFVRLCAGAPIATLDDLKRRLGTSSTILCLGNGPSSEDPALTGVAYDRLFRVNWIWRARKLFTEPDIVFTADPDSPPPPGHPIICFPQRHVGLPILARHALALRLPRGYLFLDQLPAFSDGLRTEPIPTNGALMIAVAAALRPRRIVIAGIDLYSHAAGRYPGDTDAVDGYSRQHSRDHDLSMIRQALAGYDGDATIFGESLRSALGRD